ncbi:MAG: 2-hydroxyacyl-CoA dehydratase, partial [Gammaproteobacteria bacterium]
MTTLPQEWHEGSLDDVLYLCRELVEDPGFPTVRAWRSAGGKVAGHFQVYFPEEIAHAAGLLPVKLRGAPLEPAIADSHFGSYLCSILKTSLEAALSGALELELFVSHPICDAARNLAAIWGRNFTYPCQVLYLPQNPNSAHSVDYLRDEYARLQGVVEDIAGRRIETADLQRSIEVFNRNRALLRELYVLKRDAPWLLDAADAYCLVALGGLLPREEHNELLENLLPRIRKRGTRREDRVRVVLEGGFCEQPPLDLLRMLGRTCYLVDDDLLIGLRWLTADVALNDAPLAALARAYIESSSYSPVQHDLRKPKEDMLLARVAAARADAVILAAAKMCEPGLEEQGAYVQALEAHQSPSCVSEF